MSFLSIYIASTYSLIGKTRDFQSRNMSSTLIVYKGRRVRILYLLVLIVPAASAVVAGLGGRFLGDKGAGFLTTACMGLACMLAAAIYIEVV